MDRAWIRYAQRLDFKDPAPYLRRLRQLEPKVAASGLPVRAKELRTHGLREFHQLREAALFCLGMRQRLGTTVYVAKSEDQDYDFVACWYSDTKQHLRPVQLKEVVPTDLNSSSSLAAVLGGLSKYTDSEDLTVAIHLNQAIRFDPLEVKCPALRLAELYIFAATSLDEQAWGLWGDFLSNPYGTRFQQTAA